MSADDDDEEEEGGGAAAEGEPGPESAPGAGEAAGLRNWLRGKRGWIAILVLGVMQGIFAVIMLALRTNAKAAIEIQSRQIKEYAVDMLGHEVPVKRIYQVLPASGGRWMTVGLDLVVVMGQLPEELVEGAPKPNAAEFDMFMAAVQDMEPRIRSRVNTYLQRVPKDNYRLPEVQTVLGEDLKQYINDCLDGLDFGSGLRKGIGKRRVTDVLFPLFVWQAT